jgi:hypothetical protein
MVGIHSTRLPVRYLIYVAITAIGRVLIEIVGAEHRTGMDITIRYRRNSASVMRSSGIEICIRESPSDNSMADLGEKASRRNRLSGGSSTTPTTFLLGSSVPAETTAFPMKTRLIVA